MTNTALCVYVQEYDEEMISTQPDAPVQFSQLSKVNDLSSGGDIFELGLSQALGTAKKGKT